MDYKNKRLMIAVLLIASMGIVGTAYGVANYVAHSTGTATVTLIGNITVATNIAFGELHPGDVSAVKAISITNTVPQSLTLTASGGSGAVTFVLTNSSGAPISSTTIAASTTTVVYMKAVATTAATAGDVSGTITFTAS